MVVHKPRPQLQFITSYGGSNYTFTRDQFTTAQVVRLENGFDTATIWVTDWQSKNWLSKMDAGSTITIKGKDASDANYTTLLDGIVRFINTPLSMQGELIELKCDGAGYGFAETLVNQEYGTQSVNPTLDTMSEIIRQATLGIVYGHVNNVFIDHVTDTGFSYNADNVTIEDIAGEIKYLYFPLKPANKCIQDLMDVMQAIKATNAGPHWIVDVSKNLLVCTLGASHPDAANNGWYWYYGNNQANATLVQGKDFIEYNFQKLTRETNFVVYHGALRKPASGDLWTENNAASWGSHDITVSNENGAGLFKSGSYSIKATISVDDLSQYFYYPSTQNLSLDITKLGGKFNIPTLSFWMRRNAAFTLGAPEWLAIWFVDDWATSVVYEADIDMTKFLVEADKWYNITIPIGPNWRAAEATSDAFRGYTVAGGGGNWADVDWIGFGVVSKAVDAALYVDGLQINGYITRVARENYDGVGGGTMGASTNPVKMKLINDSIAKDDSLIATDDSGTIARLAYAELLRGHSTPIVGTVKTPWLYTALPGMCFHIHAKKKQDSTFNIDKDMRCIKLTHDFTPAGATTTLFLTDDLTNSNARASWTDYNTVLKTVRPEFQDRQASNIKAREIDITQAILEKAY